MSDHATGRMITGSPRRIPMSLPSPKLTQPAASAATADDTDDRALLRRFASDGEESAFTELVRRHAPLVRSAALRCTGDAGLAEDAAQQTFIVLARRLDRARAAPSLATWLHRVAVFEASNLLRGERRHRNRVRTAAAAGDIPATAGRLVSFSSDAPSQDRLALLDQSLAALPGSDRALLIMHYAEGRSYEEIASRLEITPAAAQRRGHRALEKLGRRLRRSGTAAALLLGGLISPGSSKAAAGPLAARALGQAGTSTASAVMRGGISALMALPLTPAGLCAAALTVAGLTLLAIGREFSKTTAPALTTGRPPSPAAPMARPGAAKSPSLPETPDHLLDPEIREFIRLALTDAPAAWSWAKSTNPGMSSLHSFTRMGMKHLADRDLNAAERVLKAIETTRLRNTAFAAVVISRTRRDFQEGMKWADPRMAALGISWFDDILWPPPGAAEKSLTYLRSPLLRQRMIQEKCTELLNENEAGLETFAAALEGEERKAVLLHRVASLLMRGDAAAWPLMDELKPETLPDLEALALRWPERLLDWYCANGDPAHRESSPIKTLWLRWCQYDARAAAAWLVSRTPADKSLLATFGIRETSPANPTLKRLIGEVRK